MGQAATFQSSRTGLQSRPEPTRAGRPTAVKRILASTLVLVLVLAFLFAKSFQRDEVIFSNDGPLGVAKSASLSLPAAFKGYWVDLHWIGMNGGHSPASVTYALLWLLGPVGYAK